MRRLFLALTCAFLITGCADKIDTISESDLTAAVQTSSNSSETGSVSEMTISDNSKTEASEETAVTITDEETRVNDITEEASIEQTTEKTDETSAEIPTESPTEAATEASTEAETVAPTVAPTEPEPVSADDPYAVVKNRYQNLSANIAAEEIAIAAGKTLPCIYITTEEGQDILEKNYIKSIIDVFNCDSAYQLSAAGEVKVRGNSTSSGDEKPYRIKFDKKQVMLGLNNGNAYKSWVLLRTYWNLTPDMMSFELLKAMSGGRYFSSDSTFVNVYINGVSKGVYLLCEQIQAGNGRVEINEPKNGDTSVNVGYLMELDNYFTSEHPYFRMDYENNATVTDIDGNTRQFATCYMSVKSDTYSQEQVDFIANYTRGVYKIVYEACINNRAFKFDGSYNVVEASELSPEEAVTAVVDLDSVIDMLIISEIAHDHDIGEGSFYMAVDFSAGSKFTKLTFTAPWDYDWAYQYEEGSEGYFASTFQKIDIEEDRSNVWFITFMKADWFVNRVKVKWNSYVSSGVISATADSVLAKAQPAKNDLGNNSWYVECAARLTEYVKKRIDWLNTVWG